ncbi:GntR family transcriptional regulator [Myceligenerans halotolerans]
MSVEAKHEVLTEAIRQRIDAGQYDGELPSEAELIEEFKISRTTVRRAFTTLENEGLIGVQGRARRRVLKRERMSWPMSSWEKPNAHTAEADAWAMAVRAQGGTPHAEVSVRIEEASSGVAKALQIDPGDQVVARRRTRFVNGEPHQLADSFFPFWIAEEHPIFLQPGDISAPGGILAHVGLAQARWADEISARMPTPEEARSLKTGRGVPLIVHSRTGFDQHSRPVRHMVTLMASDRVHITYELEP